MKFLQRLGTLIGVIISWFVMALAMPIIFTIFGVAIVAACVVSMAKKGGPHPPGIQFSVFGGLTILIGIIGIAVSPSDADADFPDDPPAVEVESPEEPEVAEAGDVAPEKGPAPEPESEPDSVVAGSNEADGRLSSVQLGIDHSNELAADKARCADIDEVANAWSKLQLAKRGDTTFGAARKAAKKLERCRKRATKKVPRKQRKAVLSEKGLSKALRIK